MKKLLLMLLVVSIVLSMASCDLFIKKCTEHVDSDKDGKCDICNEPVETTCTKHVDINPKDNKCDLCGADVTPAACDTHTDADADGKCDACGADVTADDGIMTYAEFVAAEIDDEVTVKTYIQAKQGHWNNEGVDVATFYTQAPDGAYFLYDMPCSAEEYALLTPGTCIKVTGYKAEWSGEVEIIDATFEILESETPYIAPAKDITTEIGAGTDVVALQNQLVALKNATVAAAPMYKWDGSGSEGDDIYLTLSIGTKTITVVVESYLHGNGSEVYETVEALVAGDKVDIEAFLYWYNGAQPHVNAISYADPELMSYADFVAADLNTEVIVKTYVQAKQGHWNNKGVDVASFYTQAPDGAYFLYDMPCSAEEYARLTPGTCIKVKGYKAEWSGEVEIIDATFEIIEDNTYFAPAKDITSVIAAGSDVIALQNQLVAVKNATVAAAPMYKWDGSGSAGDDIYLTLTVGDKTLTVVVESYLHGNGSYVYEAVEALTVGDEVDVEAFLYWYNGAQPHVNDIIVNAMTYAEFNAAELNEEVSVITYVQAKQGHWNNSGVDVATFYTQAPDGAYFLYDMPCSAEEYALLTPGTRIQVTGYKAEWAGEVEIINATFKILPGKTYIATAKNITSSISEGTDVLALQNQLVSIKNATVAAAPMYKWDGSGSEGDDIYLTLTVGDKTLTVVVESYLHGNGSEVYEAVEALTVGATVDIEAFLYWYNGAQPHVNKVVVK